MQKLKTPFTILAFVLILSIAAYFRLIGVNWDQSQHLHPDERFMTMVVSALEPARNLGEYFDTAISPLNPNNRGYGFYVYGDLPIVVVRYLAEWLNQITPYLRTLEGLPEWLAAFAGIENWAGYDEVVLLGRVLSAISDLGSMVLVFLIGRRFYSTKVGLLAMAFSSLAVMQIQQSHFFTVDMFANFFMLLAVYFAVEIIFDREDPFDVGVVFGGEKKISVDGILEITRRTAFRNTIWFGLAFGAAVACKINAAPLAVLLPAAIAIRKFRLHDGDDHENSDVLADKPTFNYETIAFLLVLGGLISILAFRVFMPYAFKGPSFFNFSLNPLWTEAISAQRAQASGDVDFPPALQWTRRSSLYSGENMLHWGLGWPLGILWATATMWMGWEAIKGKRNRSLFLWGWVAFYFIWQSIQWNPNMRYQLPIYPLVAIIAAWFVFNNPKLPFLKPAVSKVVFWSAGAIVLVLTFFWAFAFTRIYTVDHSRVQATRWIFQNVPGPINLRINNEISGMQVQLLPYQHGYPINPGFSYEVVFVPNISGSLSEVFFATIEDLDRNPGTEVLVEVFSQDGFPDRPAIGSGKVVLAKEITKQAVAKLKTPVGVQGGQPYILRISSLGNVTLMGSAVVQESSWDDGLPLRMDGYDPFGGLYLPDLNFEMYWDDNTDKLTRFQSNLDAGDFLVISSNRQWATTTRVPERYPLTTTYYQQLIGCPPEKEVLWCYNVATPNMFTGNLGYELVATFTAYPRIFGHEFNTQFADESFTVYDATKVLIFKKSANYDSQKVADILGSVDLSKVIHVTPRNAPRITLDLLQTPEKANANIDGGTWAELYPPSSPLNANPWLGLAVWYGFIFLLGLSAFPFLFYIFRSLSDKAYPVARLAGMLLFAYGAWLASSVTPIPYTRPVLAVWLALFITAGGIAFWAQREAMVDFVKRNLKKIGLTELVFFVLFLFDLLIRLGNPDLWHPARGGERPMDFSYLNAVLKSTTFPPYDPWYAGGYINYYYWGFVLVGTPIKLLGITPSVAYNYVLPSLFAMLGMGGFSAVWNLTKNEDSGWDYRQVIGAIAGAGGLVLLGNLGTVQLIYRSLQKMMVSNELVDSIATPVLQRWSWALQGFGKLLGGEQLPISWGDYMWAPSRVMPQGDLAITEFPLFTFLYSDLHAHMIALPITLLVIVWVISMLRMKDEGSTTRWLVSLLFGGLVIGSLRPTNTWDHPTYLLLAAIVVSFVSLSNTSLQIIRHGLVPARLRPAINWVVSLVVLLAASQVFFQPFSYWYGMAYGKVEMWQNEKTPIWSYLTHWGLFLFTILMWMSWETRQWMARTPVSALAYLRPYKTLIIWGVITVVVMIAGIQFGLNVPIAWFVFPLALWALLLILQPGQTDENRIVLFMFGTGLVLTSMVEVIVLSGDIGRMNTVFKFYLQVWTLFAITAAYALAQMIKYREDWGRLRTMVFEMVGMALLAGALLYTITASFDKVRDRMAQGIPFTFDSMQYMAYATFWDQQEMALSKDYHAIKWMQENITGSPVIVEANSVEYRWGNRFTIYTGLPGVVGWNWHQRQQRALLPGEWVTSRVEDVHNFYNGDRIESTVNFLRKYSVRYIVVGELEQIQYAPEGIAKFEQFDGIFWRSVYQKDGVTIYEVAN